MNIQTRFLHTVIGTPVPNLRHFQNKVERSLPYAFETFSLIALS